MKRNSNSRQNNMYDIIVIGAGSGGLNIAGFMNNAGFKVLLIDKTDQSIGGDCLNFGCVPSKALIHIAREIHSGKFAEKFGLKTSGKIDIKKITDYLRSKKDFIRQHENAEYFRSQGMNVILGEAKFAGRNDVEVNGKTYTAKKIILATGSRPRELSIPGTDDAPVFTNENIFDIDFLPKHLVVVGGGPIGVELGQAFRYLGSEVTILARGFLDKEDPEIANILKQQLEKDGIKILLNTKTKEIRDGKTLVFDDSDGNEQQIQFDALLSSVGRVLNIENLDLDKAGIEKDNNGRLLIDKYLRTTNKNVIACGDVAGNFMFTHAAELHAGIIINNFFSPIKKKLKGDKMSWVTYTNPEIATYGMQEKDLRDKGIKYKVLEKDFSHDDRAIVDETTEGKSKIFVDMKGTVLGGTMIAHNAGELVQELLLAQTHDMDISDLAEKIYPYPTASRINRSMALEFLSGKLNDRAKWLLQILFR